MASTLRSQVCEQERADQGCLHSERIALGGSVPGGGSRSVHSQNDAAHSTKRSRRLLAPAASLS